MGASRGVEWLAGAKFEHCFIQRLNRMLRLPDASCQRPDNFYTFSTHAAPGSECAATRRVSVSAPKHQASRPVDRAGTGADRRDDRSVAGVAPRSGPVCRYGRRRIDACTGLPMRYTAQTFARSRPYLVLHGLPHVTRGGLIAARPRNAVGADAFEGAVAFCRLPCAT